MCYCFEESRIDLAMTDCGLTHFHDSKIQQALLELAPTDKAAIEAAQFGEITGSYVVRRS